MSPSLLRSYFSSIRGHVDEQKGGDIGDIGDTGKNQYHQQSVKSIWSLFCNHFWIVKVNVKS